MDFKHENNKITAYDESVELGHLSYMPDGEVLTVDHTEVSPQAEGQGLGKKLVEQIVQYARKEDKQLDPQCPFAQAVIEKYSEFQDVLNK
ncbi:MAG TPA: GNAT family N-acetyltransferase [Planococcus sp. (in: firmicutes)]|nr:GNAT family N-acetyltransferase [Planococcus sp. (in: firmicutes)]